MIATILKILLAIIVISLIGAACEAQGIHDNQALFKNVIRQDCFERYGANPGCGAPLETWLKLYDTLQGCQRLDGKMCARAEAAFNDYAALPSGTNSFGFCQLGVAQYVVPNAIAFQDYDLGWKYPTLTDSINAHIIAGRTTMQQYIAAVHFNYMVETFHRALAGRPPALAPTVPTFIEVN